MNERQAIQRLKNVDIGGLKFVVARYHARTDLAAYLLTRVAGLGDDVVQVSFLQEYRSMRHFDSSRPFEPWFMKSVVNASVKIMQKSARQVDVRDDREAESLFAKLVQSVKSVESQVEESEVQNQIWDAMRRLSP